VGGGGGGQHVQKKKKKKGTGGDEVGPDHWRRKSPAVETSMNINQHICRALWKKLKRKTCGGERGEGQSEKVGTHGEGKGGNGKHGTCAAREDGKDEKVIAVIHWSQR